MYRIFWNITKGASHSWVIDTGDGTPRIWVKGVSGNHGSAFRTVEGNGHPKGWIEVQGKLTIDQNGYAIFF